MLGVSHLSVRFVVNGDREASIAAGPCGAGCYRASAALLRPPTIAIVIAGHKPESVTFSLPAIWPTRSASAIVAQAARVWRDLKTLVDNDSLSDGHVTLHTVWKIHAPDEVAYSIRVAATRSSSATGAGTSPPGVADGQSSHSCPSTSRFPSG